MEPLGGCELRGNGALSKHAAISLGMLPGNIHSSDFDLSTLRGDLPKPSVGAACESLNKWRAVGFARRVAWRRSKSILLDFCGPASG
jgi:hypothetical protein